MYEFNLNIKVFEENILLPHVQLNRINWNYLNGNPKETYITYLNSNIIPKTPITAYVWYIYNKFNRISKFNISGSSFLSFRRHKYDITNSRKLKESLN